MRRLLAILALVTAAPACAERDAPVASAVSHAAAPSSAEVRWRAARSPAGAALLEAPARVLAAPDGRTVVAPPLRARVVAVIAIAGREVAAGAAVVEVALPDAAAAAASYLAAVGQIAAHEHRALQLEGLRAEGLARTADLATVELELARLRGERDIAATTLRAANLAVADAGELASHGGRTMLRAPRGGLVTKVTAVVGATASPDEPLVEISGGGSKRIEASLAYPLPADAEFELELAGAGPTAVQLVAIAPSREADDTTRAWFDAGTALPAGALGKLRAHLRSGTAVTIPAAAIGRDSDGTFAWRRDAGRAQRAAIRVLATSGAEALVSGLREGEQIASNAQTVAAGASEGAP